jgi:hypothetical protein
VAGSMGTEESFLQAWRYHTVQFIVCQQENEGEEQRTPRAHT